MRQSPTLLDRAREQEDLYDWAGAAETYQMGISSLPRGESMTVGHLLERKAYALYKRALQAENVGEFGPRADAAEEAYEKASADHQRVSSRDSEAITSRCHAMISFLRFVRSGTADERRKHAHEAWEHAKDALDKFDILGNPVEFCRTFNDLFASAVFCSTLSPKYQLRKSIWTEVTSRGEKAVAFSMNLADDNVRIPTMVFASALLEKASFTGLYKEGAEKCHAKAVKLWMDAEKISRDKALASSAFAWVTGEVPVDSNRDADKEILAFERALGIVRGTRDRLAIGHVLTALSSYGIWARNVPIDREELDKLMTEALGHVVEARREFMKIGFLAEGGRRMWVMSPEASYYTHYAAEEMDLRAKREMVTNAIRVLPESMTLAQESGYCWLAAGADILEGMAFLQLAKTETDREKKLELLRNAERSAANGSKTFEELDSANFIHLGIVHSYLADIRHELADATMDRAPKTEALRKTISLTRQAIDEHLRGMVEGHYTQDMSSLVNLGESRSRLGRLCRSVYELEGSQDDLKGALEAFESAAEPFSKAGRQNRSAESLWEAARIHDQLDNPAKAAERFLSAARQFRVGAEKVPRLRELFSEQAEYLEGWAEFERAKHHRVRQEYGQSRDHFTKAAELYDGLEKWRFLAVNSRAWAQIDNGEMLSREDRRREASQAFEEAASLFVKSVDILNDAERTAENADEKQSISRLLSAAEPRGSYCMARATIERARQMDVEGMSSSSSDLYRVAADELERLADEASSEQDRDDIRLRAILCRAWQKMNQAETEVISDPYVEAARLFEEIKKLSANDKARALALGHSRFCMALEAGTKFADTRDSALHATAVKSLESASAYYVRAGADTCSEYARASKLLFDAYAYLSEAGQEKDEKKAAKAYTKAEKVLQACAQSYDRAGQSGKRDQVQKLLERVRKDRELAVSLMEVLEAPSGSSSTAAFDVPLPMHEVAAGLDRFAHADVQATLIVQRRDVKVGEDMNIEIEFVNAGRTSAVLTKVENIIPSGFEVLSKSANCRIENSYIMMRGKRLDPLKTEEIALVLKPTVHGTFQLRPRILYLDDEGLYKARDVEGCDITVKELGVTGWLRGPEKRD